MWEALIKGLSEFLAHFLEYRNKSQEQKDLALSSIISATNETKIYIKNVQQKSETNRNTEEKLSRLWSAAAVPLRHFDQDLSRRCLEKSDYWLNPDNYSATDIAKFRDRYREGV